MNIFQIKKLLRKIKPERIKTSDKVRFKIENVHRVELRTVLENLENPKLLKSVEEQPSRRPHDKTYGLLFELTKRKILFVVITYKVLQNKIYLVTAFPSNKKIEKIIKKAKIRN
ncbi:MAG: hypothetical protein J7K54_05010 [Candidatus Aenigmarchaeota archaeon]|nr:hypothetical protein [Candidatus Aenigmarchaeota archaeon]